MDTPFFSNYISCNTPNFMKIKAVYTEIRNNYDTSSQRHIYEELGFHYKDYLNIIIDLSQSENILWGQIHSSRRKNIKMQ